MILSIKDNGTEEKYYLNNNNRRDIKICLNDIDRLMFFYNEKFSDTKKIFSKEEYATKFVRILDDKYIYRFEILGMYCDENFFPDDEYKYYLSIKYENEKYFHLNMSKYGKKITYTQGNESFYDLNPESFSSQDNLVLDLMEPLANFQKNIDDNNNFLMKWRNYYDMKLSDISMTKDVVKAEVDLNELREQFTFWESMIEDNCLYLPIIINELSGCRSTSLIATKTRENGSELKKDLLKDFVNVKYKYLSKTKKQIFLDTALDEFDYKINSDIAVIEFEDDCEWVIRELLDRNISKLEIKQNIIGEIEKIRRIIFGIDQIISSDIINKNLVKQILENKLQNKNTYVINEKRLEELKKEYNLNEEQALIVDKILNMEDVFLVQGPPGTGKTEIISTIVKELNKDNKIVLLTSNVGEARRNITERIKGEKELIIKDYTDLKDDSEKHKKEVYKNKINYISNQIIEKFCFDNEFIYRKSDLEQLEIVLNSYKEKLGYLESLIEKKEEVIKQQDLKNKDIRSIDNFIVKFKEQCNTIFDLIIKDDLENIKKDVLSNYLELFLELFNKSELPEFVKKINYSKKKMIELKASVSDYQKMQLYKSFNHDMSLSNELIEQKFIQEYVKCSGFERFLFNFSNIINSFAIDGKNKNDLKQVLVENEKRIRHLNYEPVKLEFKKLSDLFIFNLESSKEKLLIESDNFDNLIMDISEKIETEKNNNFNINAKINKLESFLRAYKNIKNMYPDEESFYSYLNELNNIVISGKNNDSMFYVDSMLSGSYFDRIFKYDNIEDGSILSMSTSQVAKFLRNTEIDFDYIIVDEASKCNFNDLIVSMSRTKKMVLIGDYLQLDPVVEEKDAEFLNKDEWEHIQLSNFSQLIKPIVEENRNKENDYTKSNSIGILKKQYRMSEGIFEVIESIYDSIDGFGITDGKKEFTNPNKKYENLLSLQCDGKESDRDSEDSSRYNNAEVEMVTNIMNYILKLKKQGTINNISKIGIISFYKRQSTLINNKIINIKNELKKIGIKTEVGTVDNFQGREFDLVILSCVRTEEINSWIKQIRRWNVAISRAKDKLIAIGNFEKLFNIANNTIINSKASQEQKECSVIYTKLIPSFYEKRERFSSIEECVSEFLRGGNE